MTPLERDALAQTPLSKADVEDVYNRRHEFPTYLDPERTRRVICHLCRSHERLRMETEGYEAMQAEDAKKIADLEAELAKTKDLLVYEQSRYRSALGAMAVKEADMADLEREIRTLKIGLSKATAQRIAAEESNTKGRER